MALCSYVERRRQRYYFRARLPVELAAFLGKSHLIGSLGTDDPRIAKRRAGRAIWSLAGRLEIMVSRMLEIDDIDGFEPSRAERLAVEAFRLGCAYEARRAQLREEFRTELKALVASFRDDDVRSDLANAAALEDSSPILSTTTRSQEPAGPATGPEPGTRPASGPADIRQPQTNAVAEMPPTNSPAWPSLMDAFFRDKPGITVKAKQSYEQAFNAWRGLIGDKPIASIRRPDLKLFADHLRDRPNPRGGQLNQKTIVRSLDHIKGFVSWAAVAGHAQDESFAAVQARSATSHERHAGPSRRAFTEAELIRLFRSELFLFPRDQDDRAGEVLLHNNALELDAVGSMSGHASIL